VHRSEKLQIIKAQGQNNGGGQCAEEQFPWRNFAREIFPRMDWPAGLGALAMAVNPPPVTAPKTTACRRATFGEITNN
jgi:hypothetical protein